MSRAALHRDGPDLLDRREGGPTFRHGSTYAGHAACCAAALANIALLERDGLLERGREQEQALLDALAPLAAHELVSEVRGGVGTMAAVELTGEVCAATPSVCRAGAERACGRNLRTPHGHRCRGVAAADGRSRALRPDPEEIEHGLSALRENVLVAA